MICCQCGAIGDCKHRFGSAGTRLSRERKREEEMNDE